MVSRTVKMLTGFVGLFLIGGFVLGLAQSVSTGFAGFWGGLPFTIIVVSVLSMVAYDFWDECIRKKD